MLAALENVSFGYGDHQVLDEANLALGRGQVVGLLGLNGSGKTTTMRLIANILQPVKGSVRREFRKLGYLPEERGLYRKMVVGRYLEFIAALDGLRGRAPRLEAVEWMERFGLQVYAKSRIDVLSKGNQQKVQLVSTLMGHPDLLLWDEPFSGLDALNQELLVEVLKDSRERGVTILLSTHRIEDLESWADSHYMLVDGHFYSYRPPERPAHYSIDTAQGTTTVAAADLSQAVARLTASGQVVRQVRAESGLAQTFKTLLEEKTSHGAQ